jgi:thiamine-monophosphate kinase
MLTPALENILIERLARGLPRAPFQLNALHEADAEIVVLPESGGVRLAVTADTIAEEIQTGLYTDPWLIGWMAVTANLSDLAAVGAMPLGILLAETISESCPPEFLQCLQKGIGDACRTHATPVLGGDTNLGETMSLTGCALGFLEDGHVITRRGCAPGDILFASGPLGCGNGFAFARLCDRRVRCPAYRPVARLREGRTVRRFASACMDSSDGLLATLDQLLRINGAGFRLASGWEEALDVPSRGLLQQVGLPDWFLLAGPHGEFELLFTIPPKQETGFLDEAFCQGWTPKRLGRVLPDPEIRLTVQGSEYNLDTGAIRNLAASSRKSPFAFVEALRAIDARQRGNPGLPEGGCHEARKRVSGWREFRAAPDHAPGTDHAVSGEGRVLHGIPR